MKKRLLGNTPFLTTPVGLGTWVFGGWPWNESSEKECERAIECAFERGVNLIDTAPIYGFGRSEKIVGQLLQKLKIRDQIILATKCGLSWEENTRKIWKDASRKTILKEIDESLKRLQTDWIDIYQVHWPDEAIPLGETLDCLYGLKEKGKIKVIGVSNFSVEQLKEGLRYAPIEILQTPYNYFQREGEKEILPFCIEKNIGLLTYGTLCKGLLTGKFSLENKPKDPVRQAPRDPLFESKKYQECLETIASLKVKAAEENLTLAQWVISWTISQPGVTCALVGARNPKQVRENFF